MKKILSVFLAALFSVGLVSALPVVASAAAPTVQKVHYEGKGRVEVDFWDDVSYTDVKVTLKDNNNKSYTARITERDDDGLDFKVNNFKTGRTYTFTITGISTRGSAATTVKGKFKIPSAKKVKIEEIEYKGNGKVELDFAGRVKYKRVSVTVKDSAGKKYKASVYKKDGDELNFRVSKIAAGKKYKFTVKGIRNADGSSYTKVSGSFKTPKAQTVSIQEIDYDMEDSELSVEFSRRVDYQNPRVAVKDASGNSYTAKIVEWDSDDMELWVPGLTQGQKYTFSVNGIKAKSATQYTTVKKSFRAVDS